MRLLLFLALVGAGIGAFFYVDGARTATTEDTLARIASEIARRDVSVDCAGIVKDVFDISGDEGTVRFDNAGRPEDATHLKRAVCQRLHDFPKARLEPGYRCVYEATGCPDDVLKSIQAVHTLAHEAWHLQGQADEGVAECYGLQTTAYVAQRLGADAAQAQAIASYVYANVYPTLPQSYQNGECRNGGKLDLKRGTPVFP
ncbi:MAG: hypothetical protein R3C15_09830 [Thermoleophilia bacterium]